LAKKVAEKADAAPEIAEDGGIDEAPIGAPVPEKKVDAKAHSKRIVRVSVPFQININGNLYNGEHDVPFDVAELLVEMIKRRQQIELASVEGRVKTIIRSAEGRVIIKDGGKIDPNA
jgi:hypothetical protein